MRFDDEGTLIEMTFRDAKVVITEDLSSGMTHERVYLDGQLRASEGCNTDQSGHFRIIDSIADIAPDLLCKRCFGKQAPDNDEVPG